MDAPPLSDALAALATAFAGAGIALKAYLESRTKKSESSKPAPPPSEVLTRAVLESVLDERISSLAEAASDAVVATLQERYTETLARARDHFEQIKTAVVGDALNGRSGIAHLVQEISELLRRVEDKVSELHRQAEIDRQVEARMAARDVTSPGKTRPPR